MWDVSTKKGTMDMKCSGATTARRRVDKVALMSGRRPPNTKKWPKSDNKDRVIPPDL